MLVAVSGGRDSIALLRALKLISDQSANGRAQIFVAHFNHKTRGAESDKDETFVRTLCDALDTNFVSGSSEKTTASDEASLREMRYQFLQETARELNCRYIATAHHAADQIETVLFRICRGTGLGGLAGIPKYRVVDDSITIVRPMLECMPDDIDASMSQWQQEFREDSSNDQSRYTRNFIRNEILPALADRFGEKLHPNILRLANQAQQNVEFLQGLATVAIVNAVRFESDGKVVVCCETAGRLENVVRRQMFVEIFRQQEWPLESMGFEQWQRLADLVSEPGDVAAFHIPGAVSCRKTGGSIVLAR